MPQCYTRFYPLLTGLKKKNVFEKKCNCGQSYFAIQVYQYELNFTHHQTCLHNPVHTKTKERDKKTNITFVGIILIVVVVVVVVLMVVLVVGTTHTAPSTMSLVTLDVVARISQDSVDRSTTIDPNFERMSRCIPVTNPGPVVLRLVPSHSEAVKRAPLCNTHTKDPSCVTHLQTSIESITPHAVGPTNIINTMMTIFTLQG